MLKLNQAYYKTLTGFFKTEKTDIDFLKQCFKNKLKNDFSKKYNEKQVEQIINTIKNTQFFYVSSGNLWFYIKDKKIFITKAGQKAQIDIVESFNIPQEKIESVLNYDKTFDSMYSITRNKKQKQDIDIDILKSMFN